MVKTKQMWLGFRVLCLLTGSGWVLDQWRPETLRGLTRTTVHLGALAVVFWIAGRMREEVRTSRGVWGRIGAWGAALVALPQIAIAGAGGRVSGLTEVLVFGLVPVVVVVTVAQRAAEFGVAESPLRKLSAALSGLGGLALLVPFTFPAGWTGVAWLLTIIAAGVVSGVAAVHLHRLLGEAGVLGSAAAVCGGASLVAGGFCWVDWTGWGTGSLASVAGEAARCLLVDGPILLLTVWLLRGMAPARFSARYLVIPLVTIVEGFVLVRPEWNWTMAAGFLLLAGGCIGLSTGDSEEVRMRL